MSHSSYAHTVSDPTDIVNKLREQIVPVKHNVRTAFGKRMEECLSDLEAKDAAARANDPNVSLQHRLTASKMLVSAAYVYLDTIWMYLKTKGIDPSTHPVHAELERVHAYFDKLKKVDTPDLDKQSNRLRVDADASQRMVHAATKLGKHTRFDEKDSVKQAPEEDSAALTKKPKKRATGKAKKTN